MLIHGFDCDPRAHEPTRVSERPPRIRAVRFAEFVAAGPMHPKGDPALVGAFRFQPDPPNGRQRFVKSLAEVRGARGAEPVPLFEIFGAFAVDVVDGILYVAAQVTLALDDEAHVHWRRQNAGRVPLYLG